MTEEVFFFLKFPTAMHSLNLIKKKKLSSQVQLLVLQFQFQMYDATIIATLK